MQRRASNTNTSNTSNNSVASLELIADQPDSSAPQTFTNVDCEIVAFEASPVKYKSTIIVLNCKNDALYIQAALRAALDSIRITKSLDGFVFGYVYQAAYDKKQKLRALPGYDTTYIVWDKFEMFQLKELNIKAAPTNNNSTNNSPTTRGRDYNKERHIQRNRAMEEAELQLKKRLTPYVYDALFRNKRALTKFKYEIGVLQTPYAGDADLERAVIAELDLPKAPKRRHRKSRADDDDSDSDVVESDESQGARKHSKRRRKRRKVSYNEDEDISFMEMMKMKMMKDVFSGNAAAPHSSSSSARKQPTRRTPSYQPYATAPMLPAMAAMPPMSTLPDFGKLPLPTLPKLNLPKFSTVPAVPTYQCSQKDSGDYNLFDDIDVPELTPLEDLESFRD